MSRFSHLETGGPPKKADPAPAPDSATPDPDAAAIDNGSGRAATPAPPATPDADDTPVAPPPARAAGLETDGSVPPAAQAAKAAGRDYSTPEDDAGEALAKAEDAYYSGNWDAALRSYSRSLQLDPRLVRPWVGQVYALLRKRQDKEAMTWVNRALERFPDDPSLLSVRGVVFSKQGMFQRAIGASDFALSHGSTREAWLARGEILLGGHGQNAEGCFEKALEFDPDGKRTLAHIALAFNDARKFGGAHQYFKRAADRWPTNAWLTMQWGLCADRLGYREEARQAIERAHQLDADRREIRQAYDRVMNTNPVTRFLRRLRKG